MRPIMKWQLCKIASQQYPKSRSWKSSRLTSTISFVFYFVGIVFNKRCVFQNEVFIINYHWSWTPYASSLQKFHNLDHNGWIDLERYVVFYAGKVSDPERYTVSLGCVPLYSALAQEDALIWKRTRSRWVGLGYLWDVRNWFEAKCGKSIEGSSMGWTQCLLSLGNY